MHLEQLKVESFTTSPKEKEVEVPQACFTTEPLCNTNFACSWGDYCSRA